MEIEEIEEINKMIKEHFKETNNYKRVKEFAKDNNCLALIPIWWIVAFISSLIGFIIRTIYVLFNGIIESIKDIFSDFLDIITIYFSDVFWSWVLLHLKANGYIKVEENEEKTEISEENTEDEKEHKDEHEDEKEHKDEQESE